MTKILLFFFFILLFTLPIFAQSVDTAWVRRYNGPGNWVDEASAIAVDTSGNVYVTGRSVGIGTSSDYATIKYDSHGTELWVRRYNGIGNGADEASAIAVDVDGNVYVTGRSQDSSLRSDYVTIKYNSNGDQLWVRRYNGPGDDWDWAHAMALDGSGNVYVTGVSPGAGTYEDYATIKYHSDGNTEWLRRYDSPVNYYDEAFAIAVDESGNVYVTGASSGEYATIKYKPNGDTVWVRRYSGPGSNDNRASAITVDGAGDIIVTGTSLGNGYTDYATIKYYPNGDTAWVRRYNGLGGYSDDHATDITSDISGNVYVTGYSGISTGTYYDYATIKYDLNGDQLWVRRYDGPGSKDDESSAIVVDASGNVYVTGYSAQTNVSPYNHDYATLKYSPEGDTIWVRRYNGPGNGLDEATAIAIDDDGNVYVTGRSDAGGMAYFDYTTIKYVQTPNDVKDETGGRQKHSKFALSQNYPNPFNSLTTINYSVERVGLVHLTIYNVLGQKVRTLIDERKQKGSYSVQWDGHNDKGQELPSGAYFYILKLGEYTSSKKMILLK